MSKIGVVFWSGTGNTEEMAKYIVEGCKEVGAETTIYTASEFNSAKVNDFDVIAFGCSSMGDEVLEETEFQPMWDEVEPALKGKQIVLFGSYGWGDGEWMRNWEERCKEIGAILKREVLMCNEAPDDADAEKCRNLGKSIAM